MPIAATKCVCFLQDERIFSPWCWMIKGNWNVPRNNDHSCKKNVSEHTEELFFVKPKLFFYIVNPGILPLGSENNVFVKEVEQQILGQKYIPDILSANVETNVFTSTLNLKSTRNYPLIFLLWFSFFASWSSGLLNDEQN